MKLLLDLLCLCLLCLTGKTLCDKIGPAVITVKGGTDVMLPCSLSTKEDIEFKLFDWRKVAQKDDGLKEVFLYDGGSHYNNGLYGQSEEFKGRVSHLQDELKDGNASIIIRNTKISDSGVYTCDFPRLQPPQKFYIKLVVQPKVITMKEDSDVVLPCSLSTEENIEFKRFVWRKVAQKDDGLKEVFLYDSGIHYNNGRPGQSEEFKGRVSHFQDELKHANASIIIRNTKISDNGVYTCAFPRLQPPQTFYIELVVGSAPKPSITSLKETKDWRLLQCEVQGKPKPEVKWQDSDGNILNAEKPQVTIKRGLFYITLNTTVTKSDRYRCVAKQEKIRHQVSAEIDVYIHGSGLCTGWSIALVLLLLLLLVAGVLAVLVYKGYITLNCNKGPKVIKVEEGRDVILPCSLWTKKDIRSTQFNWQTTDDDQKVFLYDKGDLYSDERPGQSEQFKGRVSHFKDELEQGNASIIIRNTRRADNGEYRCIIDLDHLVVVGPKVIKVEEGSDVTLPCSLWTKKDITSTLFIWQKTYDDQKVFLYDKGVLYSDGCPGQSEQFKGRVSHFPDELKQGNASIIIRNTTRADSGEYRCSFPSIQKPQIFYKLVVVPKVIKVEEGRDVILPCSLITKEDLQLTQFNWKKVFRNTDDDQKVFLYDKGDLYSDERPGQSEQFKDRVSHFPDELKQGNASIIIRNTTRADSGDYRCDFQSVQGRPMFQIMLDVGSTPEPTEHHPLMNGMDGIELHP